MLFAYAHTCSLHIESECMSSERSIHSIQIVKLMRISWVEYGQKHYHRFNDKVNFCVICSHTAMCALCMVNATERSAKKCPVWKIVQCKTPKKTLAHHTDDHFDVFPYFSILFWSSIFVVFQLENFQNHISVLFRQNDK